MKLSFFGVLALSATGCAVQHDALVGPSPNLEQEPRLTPDPTTEPDRTEETTPDIRRMVDCVEQGEPLALVASVNNNDTMDHGTILTSAFAPDGSVLVGSSDFALKLWSADGTLTATRKGATGTDRPLLYTTELPDDVPAMSIAFLQSGNHAVVGRASGAVQFFDITAEGLSLAYSHFPWSDTAPVDRLATSSSGQWIAVGTMGIGENLFFLERDIFEPRTPDAELTSVSGLAFIENALFVSGTREGQDVILAVDPISLTVRTIATCISSECAASLALVAKGERLLVSTESELIEFDRNGAVFQRVSMTSPSRHLAVSADGSRVLTLNRSNELAIRDAASLSALLVQTVDAGVTVGFDPANPERIVVTRQSGSIDFFGCADSN